MNKQLSLTSKLIFLPLLIFLFYYPYRAITWRIEMAFHEGEFWYFRDVKIPTQSAELAERFVYFGVWIVPVIFGGLGLIAALRILACLSRGEVFTTRLASLILWMGVFGALSSFMHLIAAALSPMILSWNSPDGPEALRFWYNSSHIASVFYGLAFVMMGWVMKEATRIAAENNEFV